MTHFKDVANEYYWKEAAKLLFEQNGQRKLVFIPEDIFEAFKTYKNISSDLSDDLKRAIVIGLGKAIEHEIEIAICNMLRIPFEKKGSQIFNGQVTDKRDKLQLWVEVIVFYRINSEETQFSFRHTFTSATCFSDESIAKITKGIHKQIASSVKNCELACHTK